MSSLPTTVALQGTCCAEATKGRQTTTSAAVRQNGRSILRSLAFSESNPQIEFGYRWMTIEVATTGPLVRACIVGNPSLTGLCKGCPSYIPYPLFGDGCLRDKIRTSVRYQG